MTAATAAGSVLDWPAALAAFGDHLRARGLRQRTRASYIGHLRTLATHAPAGPWAVSPELLAAWLDHRGASRRISSTVARLFYSWARQVGHTSGKPCPPPGAPHARTDHDATRLALKVMPPAWSGPVSEHVNAMRAAGSGTRTIDVHRTYLHRLARVHPAGPWTVTAVHLNGWLAGMDWRPETRRSARNVLCAFYGRAVRAGVLAESPAHQLDRVRIPRALPRPAPGDALTVALAHATDHDRLMLLLGALAGLRAAEIAGLHLTRGVHPEHLFITGKGGHQRLVPLHPRLAAEIAAEQSRRRAGHHGTGLRNAAASECSADGYLFPSPGGHMSPGNVSARLGNVLPDSWTAHTLRHRFASQAYATTRDLRAVQELLGHASPATTARYTQVPPDALRLAVIGAGDGLPW